MTFPINVIIASQLVGKFVELITQDNLYTPILEPADKIWALVFLSIKSYKLSKPYSTVIQSCN